MAWGSGTFTRVGGSTHWVDDKNAAINIVASRHDTNDEDISTGINQCLNKDGSNAATGNLNLGTNKLTAVKDATLRSDAPNLGNIQDGLGVYSATVGGTADVITLTPSPAITAYVAGQRFQFLASGQNTTNVTVNVSGLGAKALTKKGTVALVGGDIFGPGAFVEIFYDGTRFQLLSVVPGSGGFTVTLTGCTTSPTGTAVWVRNELLVTLFLPAVTATSNAATCTFTGLPVGIQPARTMLAALGAGALIDNSVSSNTGAVQVNTASGTITFLIGGGTNSFTAAGTKGVNIASVFSYHLA